MAPGGRREGGHGAWVKKAPAGGEKKEEEVDGGYKGREGKGKVRSKGDRGSRREEDEAKGKGRAKGKHKKEEGRESNSGEEEAEDGGNALLKMLKGNTQTTKRFSYTKAELLKIATLPASNVKPVDLDPIIDKDNKDSVLLIRIAASREEHEANGEDRARRNSRQARTEGEARPDASVPEAAEAERPAEEEEDEEKAKAFEKWLGRNLPKLEAAKADLSAKAAAGAASSGSTMTAAAPKWPPTAAAMAAAMAGAKSGAGAGGAGGANSSYMSLLAQQGGASNMSPAHAMQAAAYMQAMTQMQLAAAASRNSYGSQTWNAYNQYLNPYMAGAAYGGYGMDPFTAAQQAAASNLTEAMQAKLGAMNHQRIAAIKAAATAKAAKATAKAKAPKAVPKTPPAKAGAKASPVTAPVPAPAVAGLLPKTNAPSSPQLPAAAPAPAVPAAAPAQPPLEGLKKTGDEEDEAGCSQS